METLEQLISKAEMGDGRSCFELGQKFAIGDGTDADESKSLDCYAFAATRGHPMAQFVIGTCLANGIGIDADGEEAGLAGRRAKMAKGHLRALGRCGWII